MGRETLISVCCCWYLTVNGNEGVLTMFMFTIQQNLARLVDTFPVESVASKHNMKEHKFVSEGVVDTNRSTNPYKVMMRTRYSGSNCGLARMGCDVQLPR